MSCFIPVLSQVPKPSLNAIQKLLPSLYISADHIAVTDGSLITSIPDRSAHRYVLTQSTTSLKATFQQSGGPNCPGIFFPLSATYPLPGGFSVSTQNCSIYAVVRFRNWDGAAVLLGMGSGTNNLLLYGNNRSPAVNVSGTLTNYNMVTNPVFNGDAPFTYALISTIHGSSSLQIRVNGIGQTFAANALVTATGGQFGSLSAATNWFGGNVVDLIVFPVAHTAPQIAIVEGYLNTTRGLPQATISTTQLIVADGDSIVQGRGSATNIDGDEYSLIKQNFGSGWGVLNLGVNAEMLATMITANRPAPYYSAGRAVNVVVGWGGRNDISGGATSAAVYANMKVYGAQQHTTGYKFIFLDMLPGTDITGANETSRVACNTLYAADFNVATGNAFVFTPAGGVTYADAFIKVSALTGITFPDGIHPSYADDIRIAPLIEYAISLVTGVNSINGFQPSLWLRGDIQTFNDTGYVTPTSPALPGIGSWQDMSGNSNGITQATAGSQAQYEVLGGPNAGAAFFNLAQTYNLPAGFSVSTQSVAIYLVKRFRNRDTVGVVLAIGSGVNNLYLYFSIGQPNMNVSGSLNGYGNNPIFTSFLGDAPYKFHIISLSPSNTATVFRMDGNNSSALAAPALVTAVAGQFGSLAGAANECAEIVDLLIFPVSHSAATAAIIEGLLGGLHGLPQATIFTKKMLVCDGDSITFGKGSLTTIDGDYPSQAKISLGVSWGVLNFGLNAETLASMITAAPTRIDTFYLNTRLKNIVIIWGGTNDLTGNASGATVFTNYQTYGNARHAVGWKVIVVSCMTRTDMTGPQQTQRGIFNVDLRTAFTGATSNAYIFTPAGGTAWADLFVDMDALQVATGFAFQDGVHPTAGAYAANVAPTFVAAVGML